MTSTGYGFGILIALATLQPAVWSKPFQPDAESDFWKQTREGLLTTGELTKTRWVFVEGMTSSELDAAEYLADSVRQGETVGFQAAVLVRRGGAKSGWRVRELPMRALCAEGRLERQGLDGGWQPYQGRGPQARTMAWICGLPPRKVQPRPCGLARQ